MQLQHLMRTWYKTDYKPETDTEYVGVFSENLPRRDGMVIVNVDWSTPGEVEVTWLVQGQSPLGW